MGEVTHVAPPHSGRLQPGPFQLDCQYVSIPAESVAARDCRSVIQFKMKAVLGKLFE